MTSRELVYRTLEFRHAGRIPRDLWKLPWTDYTYPEVLAELHERYTLDIVTSPKFLKLEPYEVGDAYRIGNHIDAWGCKFEQRENGIIGEVKEAISKEEDFSDFGENVHIPVEWLSVDTDKVNEFCRSTEQFVLAGCYPRPFERMQFIRGTEQFFIDLMLKEDGLFDSLNHIHEFYKRQLILWAQTDVDGLMIMDDWGSQISLLINPELWRQVFKPLYADYAKIAKEYGKKLFMHSDGYILDIIPDLIEIGVDAINSQLFCMGIEALRPFAGKITFWGEIDRQNLLPSGTPDDIEKAVDEIYRGLYRQGGCIAQCEFGPGARPENVRQVYESWDEYL